MKLKKISTLLLLLTTVIVFSTSCSNQTLQYEAITVEGGYGYRILEKGKIVIYQPFIPGLAQVTPFATKQDALKIAKLVCEKIQKGEEPSVSKEEVLKEIGK